MKKKGSGSNHKSEAYKAGCEAYRNGESSNSNPYPGNSGDNEDRYQWYMGYYDERIDPILKKEPSWKTPTKVQNQ